MNGISNARLIPAASTRVKIRFPAKSCTWQRITSRYVLLTGNKMAAEFKHNLYLKHSKMKSI